MIFKTYASKANKVWAIEYMGFNWEDFIYFPEIVDWSISDKLILTLKGGGIIKLRLCDWFIIYSDGECDVLSSKDFYDEYDRI